MNNRAAFSLAIDVVISSARAKGARPIPEEEKPWYARNGMHICAGELGGINEVVSLLPLRADIHKYIIGCGGCTGKLQGGGSEQRRA